MRNSVRGTLLIAFACMLTLCTSPAPAQSPDAAATEFVPQIGLVAVRLRPQALLNSKDFAMMPIEVGVAWCEEEIGIDPTTIEEVKVVFAMPMGPGPPPMGALIKTSEDFDPANISAEFMPDRQPRNIGGHTVYTIKVDRNEELYLSMVDARTALLTTPIMFQSMSGSKQGSGPLADILAANPMGDRAFQLAVAIEPARPMLLPMAEQGAQQLPPDLQELAQIPSLLNAVIVSSSANPMSGEMSAEFLTADANDAGELQGIMTRGIAFARAMFVAQMNEQIRDEGKVPDAQRAYANRLAVYIADLLTPVAGDDRLTIKIESGASVGTTGVLVGLLLPAVQSARTAARRMSSSNNLKQIGLAMHNYHSAYKQLPGPALTDDTGRPLLSWRVMILPFIEQQELYEQFHLDEPWDSEHNIQLLDMMPAVYSHPGAAVRPSETIYQANVGEGQLFVPGETNKFRDILDGLSNTIMAFEASEDESVPWTKPADVEIDMQDPMAAMGTFTPGGFNVLMGDGAVRFITHQVDTGLFKALLTRASRETVGEF